ncbi:MAG: hypothetical protein NTY46_06990 [Candidatus Sumerlaeota bacterium]|nr:hypothetical protein [Candidatus Sumerlaeota bacterium]
MIRKTRELRQSMGFFLPMPDRHGNHDRQGDHGCHLRRTRTGTDKARASTGKRGQARASTGKRGQTRTGTDEEHFFFGGHDVLCLLYQVIAEKLNS